MVFGRKRTCLFTFFCTLINGLRRQEDAKKCLLISERDTASDGASKSAVGMAAKKTKVVVVPKWVRFWGRDTFSHPHLKGCKLKSEMYRLVPILFHS